MTENERVKEVRKSKHVNLTMEKFGEKLGVGKSTISRIESGNIIVTDQMRLSICREFGVSEQWLKTGEGEMFVEKPFDQQLHDFIDSIGEQETFKRRLLETLSTLNEKDWEALAGMAKIIAGSLEADSPAEPPQKDELSREDYHRELDRMLDEEKGQEYLTPIARESAGA